MLIKALSFLICLLVALTNEGTIRATQPITPQVMDNLLKIVDAYFFSPTPLYQVPIKKFLRTAFHDCMGGCDASLNLFNTDNRGLEIVMSKLATAYSSRSPNYTYISTYLSRADFLALAEQRALGWGMKNGGESPKFKNSTPIFQYGRIANPNGLYSDQLEGKFPDGRANWTLPSTDKNHPTTVLEGLLTGLPGVNQTDIVILLGLHGAGGLNMNNSGFQGPWLQFLNGTNVQNIVNNQYYIALFGVKLPYMTMYQIPSNQSQFFVPSDINYTSPDPEFGKMQWVTKTTKAGVSPGLGKIFINADLAIYYNFTAYPNGTAPGKYCPQSNNATLFNCNAKDKSYLPLSSRATLGFKYAYNNTAFINDLVPSFLKLVKVKPVGSRVTYSTFYPQITCLNSKQVCSGDIFFAGCGVTLGKC